MWKQLSTVLAVCVTGWCSSNPTGKDEDSLPSVRRTARLACPNKIPPSKEIAPPSPQQTMAPPPSPQAGVLTPNTTIPKLVTPQKMNLSPLQKLGTLENIERFNRAKNSTNRNIIVKGGSIKNEWSLRRSTKPVPHPKATLPQIATKKK